ncbi:hypothetical protein BIY27_25690 [Gibbsiella quercinecans]|uniref:hypothetical protein n=1 Tax=Gibbsiella quercinecans TaxID=929813 RepID=UPI000EF1ADC6|nr:hypothetical protein [Gibbsiella quercinecans]RLM02138.1 hypothetical protein BIY27_25690 [Gibbsiella quercinecans]
MTSPNTDAKPSAPYLPRYFAEIISGGVRAHKLNDDGKYQQYGDVIPLGQIIRRADAGEWDHLPSLGLLILAEWSEAYRKPSPIDTLAFYRWIVAHLFVTEQVEKHGTPVYVRYQVKMAISLGIERLAMTNNIELALIDRFGKKNGVKNAISFYQRMISIDGSNILRLSDFGRETLVELHDSFIQQLIAHDLPSAH